MSKRDTDDFEDFGDPDDFDEDYSDDDDIDDIEIDSVGFLGRDQDGPDEDIFAEEDPDNGDLPALLELLLNRGAMEAVGDVKSTLLEEFNRKAEGEDRDIEIHTVFETDEHAKFPGFSRSLLSVQRGNITLGSLLCKSLLRDLKEHYEDLLFGLEENVYLHATRSYTLCNGHVCASTRFFWSEEESPYPLIISNVADIVENEELVYLIIGDMVENLVSRVENNQSGTDGKETKKNGV